jgi:hypothetical protein
MRNLRAREIRKQVIGHMKLYRMDMRLFKRCYRRAKKDYNA